MGHFLKSANALVKSMLARFTAAVCFEGKWQKFDLASSKYLFASSALNKNRETSSIVSLNFVTVTAMIPSCLKCFAFPISADVDLPPSLRPG